MTLKLNDIIEKFPELLQPVRGDTAVEVSRPCAPSRTQKIGPVSRSQASSVGMRGKSTPTSASTPPSASAVRAASSLASSATTTRTCSRPCSARTMPTVPRTARSSRPGQVSGLWGHESQVAAWGSHSAGQR